MGCVNLSWAVEALNVTKVFGSIRALDCLSFNVGAGEIYGLIGPNGAGKTTALRIVSTLLLPTSGTVKIFGMDVVKEAATVRRFISYLPEEAGSYGYLSGQEYLEFMAKFHTKNENEIREMVREAAEISGLGDRLRDKTKTYSKGMKRRLLVARALMIRPKLAVHAFHIREIIRRYTQEHGVTVLISSHNMLEVEHLCDRVALVNKGRIVAEGKPKELMERFDSENLEEVFARVVKIA
jgi:ABC-2 type transport system ATP-binding protein